MKTNLAFEVILGKSKIMPVFFWVMAYWQDHKDIEDNRPKDEPLS